jgi:hypothetical protein
MAKHGRYSKQDRSSSEHLMVLKRSQGEADDSSINSRQCHNEDDPIHKSGVLQPNSLIHSVYDIVSSPAHQRDLVLGDVGHCAASTSAGLVISSCRDVASSPE